MPTVLAIVPATPPALEGRNVLGERLTLELHAEPSRALMEAPDAVFDLLVLGGMPVDAQQRIAASFQEHRRWRLVPVLYLYGDETPGIAIPAGYRPEIDSVLYGALDSAPVQRRIRVMAREGVGDADLVVAGSYELDPLRGRFRFPGKEIALTDREAEVLSILLSHPGQTVAASEIILRGWGTEADTRYLQILRRHVSNIRRKLGGTLAARALTTVRGAGYRFDLRRAG
ncbi:MAG: winged helix-turn-helix domain-containing protein [Tepidiformaceae bacterium]